MEVEEHLSNLLKEQEQLRQLTPLRENLKRVRTGSRPTAEDLFGNRRNRSDRSGSTGGSGQALSGFGGAASEDSCIGTEKKQLRNRLRKLVDLPEEQVEKLNDLVEKRGRLLSLEQVWRDCGGVCPGGAVF